MPGLMRYMGSKGRIAKPIASIIREYMRGNPVYTAYYEPFVGAGAVLGELSDLPHQRYASDIHSDLIALYHAVQWGNIPCYDVGPDFYNEVKNDTDPTPSPMRAFIGFGCSYGGKWFGGYARGGKDGRNYARESSSSIAKFAPSIAGVHFYIGDYSVTGIGLTNAVIYCDPPYAGTTGYKNKFDHEAFYRWVEEVAGQNNTVFISEYQCPIGIEVWSKTTNKRMNNNDAPGGSDKVERLFMVGGNI